MLWIISGPSSVGKSTFLASPRCREITGLGPETPVTFAFQEEKAETAGDAFFHYNMLRPVARFQRQVEPPPSPSLLGRLGFPVQRLGQWFGAARPARSAEEWQQAATEFARDPGWTACLQVPGERRALVLVADREVILQRLRARKQIESAMDEGRSNVYQSRQWERLYERIDLPSLYRAWCAELRARGLEPLLLDSNDPHFRPLASL